MSNSTESTIEQAIIDWLKISAIVRTQAKFTGVVARGESLRGRMGESARQVERLFESLLAESFGG